MANIVYIGLLCTAVHCRLLWKSCEYRSYLDIGIKLSLSTRAWFHQTIPIVVIVECIGNRQYWRLMSSVIGSSVNRSGCRNAGLVDRWQTSVQLHGAVLTNKCDHPRTDYAATQHKSVLSIKQRVELATQLAAARHIAASAHQLRSTLAAKR